MSSKQETIRSSYKASMEQRLNATVIGSISKPRLTKYGLAFAAIGAILLLLPAVMTLTSPFGPYVIGSVVLLVGLGIASYRQEMVLGLDRWEIVSGFVPFAKRWSGEFAGLTHLDFGRETLHTGRFAQIEGVYFTTWVCVRDLTAPTMRFEAMSAPEAYFSESEARAYADRLAARLKIGLKVRENVRDMGTGR